MSLAARIALLAAACVISGGCRCKASQVTSSAPAEWAASPSVVTLSAYVRSSQTAEFTVTNRGGVAATLDLTLDASGSPFTVSPSYLRLGEAESTSVDVQFAPTEVGEFSEQVHLGSLVVVLHGTALPVPLCAPTDVCSTSTFDESSARCVDRPKANGSACQTRCVFGVCLGGACTGTFASCDDGNQCTVDACDESAGCGHVVVECPAPANPCQRARCEPTGGCLAEDVVDGTLCGADDCLRDDVNVCIQGECVVRPRPVTGRCSNRWVPATIPARREFGLAFDESTRRTVLFGGEDGSGSTFFGDTWEWDGTTWAQRFPAASPSPRRSPTLFYDATRHHLVLFGGITNVSTLHDMWEWDGATWLPLSTTVPFGECVTPHAVDGQGRLFVLDCLTRDFDSSDAGGPTRAIRAPLWLWNGRSWETRSPLEINGRAGAFEASFDVALAFDARRGVLVAVMTTSPWSASVPPPSLRVFEWGGQAWVEVVSNTSPTSDQSTPLAYDEGRARVVLWGAGSQHDETWEWDGTAWQPRPTTTSPPQRASFAFWAPEMISDSARHRLVLVGAVESSDVWELGDTWEQRTLNPPLLYGRAISYDAARRRVVLFGGLLTFGTYSSDSWEWTGTQWLEVGGSPAPAPRAFASLVPQNNGVLLFGGEATNSFNDTWNWNGVTWSPASPVGTPSPRYLHAMAYDRRRHRTVLFGGHDGTSTLADTWEYDGTTWGAVAPLHAPPSRASFGMAYDEARERTTLFGGYGFEPDGGVTLYGDTWEWDGADWHELAPSASPTPRRNLVMAYDDARKRVMLYGGLTTGLGWNTDTWEWDGATWVRRQPLTSPTPVSRGYSQPSVMTFDATRRRLVLVQGADTWLFVP